ncbi:hypothetical protein MKX01_036332 [Papaver californicum]|nr:hypothetical protein MKX01_036332 [Papaver californicum]
MAEDNETEDKDKEKVERMIVVALWCVQDSPNSRPLMSSVVKMLEGGAEILSPSNPFRYLYEVGAEYAAGGTIGVDIYLTTTRTNSSQNQNTSSLMRQYEIQIASS